jgi:hypothetical protein
LDDGALDGNVGDMTLAFQAIKTEGAKIGLQVNEKKCELITSDSDVVQQFQFIAPEVIVVEPNDAVLLAAPVGGEQSVDCILKTTLTELQRLGICRFYPVFRLHFRPSVIRLQMRFDA